MVNKPSSTSESNNRIHHSVLASPVEDENKTGASEKVAPNDTYHSSDAPKNTQESLGVKLPQHNPKPSSAAVTTIPIHVQIGEGDPIRYIISIHHKPSQESSPPSKEEIELITRSITNLLQKTTLNLRNNKKLQNNEYISGMCLFMNAHKGIVGTISLADKETHSSRQINFHSEKHDETILEELCNLLDPRNKYIIKCEKVPEEQTA